MEIRKEKIALDLDDTLADTMSAVIDRINRERGTSITKADFRDWGAHSLEEEHGIDRGYTIGMYHTVWAEESERISPMASIDLLKRLTELADVDIVTGRDRGNLDHFTAWLEKNYPGVEFRKTVIVSAVREKAFLGYDTFIDDGPTLATEIIKEGDPNKRHLLLDRIYNRHIEEDGMRIIRVGGIDEAIETVLKEHGP